MKKTSVEQMLIDSLKGALEYEKGKKKLKTNARELPDPAPNLKASDVQKIRKIIFNMTQNEFAIVLNISLPTLRSWEQGTRKPSDSALRLLQLLSAKPGILKSIKKAA